MQVNTSIFLLLIHFNTSVQFFHTLKYIKQAFGVPLTRWAVATDAWASSSWMGEEARVAFAEGNRDAVYYWVRAKLTAVPAGMAEYLTHELPANLGDAVAVLAQGTV